MIKIIPIGEVDGGLLDWLSGQLPSGAGQLGEVGAGISPPRDAYNPTRRQYNAPDLLDAMARVRDSSPARLVGVIDEDIHAVDLTFAFGWSEVNRREILISLPRLRPTFYGQPPNVPTFRDRVLKETLHQLGHSWGLRHCPDEACVMHLTNTPVDSDRKEAAFCPACAQALMRCEG